MCSCWITKMEESGGCTWNPELVSWRHTVKYHTSCVLGDPLWQWQCLNGALHDQLDKSQTCVSRPGNSDIMLCAHHCLGSRVHVGGFGAVVWGNGVIFHHWRTTVVWKEGGRRMNTTYNITLRYNRNEIMTLKTKIFQRARQQWLQHF